MVDQHFTQRISQRVDNLLRCRRAHAEPSFDCGNINAPSNAKQLSTFDQARESSLHSMARTMMQESARCQNLTFWKLLNDLAQSQWTPPLSDKLQRGESWQDKQPQ